MGIDQSPLRALNVHEHGLEFGNFDHFTCCEDRTKHGARGLRFKIEGQLVCVHAQLHKLYVCCAVLSLYCTETVVTKREGSQQYRTLLGAHACIPKQQCMHTRAAQRVSTRAGMQQRLPTKPFSVLQTLSKLVACYLSPCPSYLRGKAKAPEPTW